MWSNKIKIALFSKNTKIAQRMGALPPDPHSHQWLRAPPPDPVCDTFEYTSLLNTSLTLDICTFQLLILALSLTKILVMWQKATGPWLLGADV